MTGWVSSLDSSDNLKYIFTCHYKNQSNEAKICDSLITIFSFHGRVSHNRSGLLGTHKDCSVHPVLFVFSSFLVFKYAWKVFNSVPILFTLVHY